jgi:hypothetical protein
VKYLIIISGLDIRSQPKSDLGQPTAPRLETSPLQADIFTSFYFAMKNLVLGSGKRPMALPKILKVPMFG